MARCDVSILSAAVYSQISSSARLEALNAISYLAESHAYSLDCVLSDINIAIDTIGEYFYVYRINFILFFGSC